MQQLFFCFTKQATLMRRSTVLSLPFSKCSLVKVTIGIGLPVVAKDNLSIEMVLVTECHWLNSMEMHMLDARALE